MKTVFITLLNVIAVVPIFLIIVSAPVVFIMTFDSPVTGNSTQMWIVRILMYGVIPLGVALCIFLSQWKHSIIWALIAASPMLYVSYNYFLKPDSFLMEYEKSQKDFACQKGYLSIKEQGFGTPIPGMQWIDWYQKRGLNSAHSDRIGALYNGYFVPNEELGYKKGRGILKPIYSNSKSILQECKNTENKSIFEIYPLANQEIINEINEKINNRNKK